MGLKDIVINCFAINFYGEPGTGKSIAAEGLANALGTKLIRADYDEIAVGIL